MFYQNIDEIVSGLDSYKKSFYKTYVGTNFSLSAKLEIEGWKNGKKVNNGKDWRVMEYDRPIGAKYGKESRWQRIEKSAGVIHGHPITEQEYLKLIK